MDHLDNSNEIAEAAKWAGWTLNPARSSKPSIKHVSAILFVTAAGTNLIGLMA